MVEASSGAGEALTPTVITQSNVGTPSAEADARTRAEAIDNARRGVASAEAKVVRQQEHLEGAKVALARAQAELAAAEAEA